MATNIRMPNKIIHKLHKPHHNAKKTKIFDELIFERVHYSMKFVGEAVKKKRHKDILKPKGSQVIKI